MLMGLIGGEQGFRELLNRMFEGFAINSSVTFAQPTTRPYDDYRKGRRWTLKYKGTERIKTSVRDLNIVTPGLSQWGGNAVFDDKKSNCNIRGLMTDYVRVETPHMCYGRYLDETDMQQRRKVCILGKKMYKDLFPGGGNPCGQLIGIDSVYCSVVGVDCNAGNVQISGSAEESVVIPLPLMQRAYNLRQTVRVICVTRRSEVKMNKVAQPMRDVITRAYHIDPTDEKSVTVFNTEVMCGMVGSLFAGISFLVWFVGIGTLLAGAIGVSSIMMVIVREWTTEIDIRRAIGATPRTVLGQVIVKSTILITITGMSEILFVVIILQLAEMSTAIGGFTAAHFQVGFWTAVGTVIVLSLLGVLAGLAPALRAMSIKPVDTMRDE